MNNLEHTLKEAREDFDQCQTLTDLDQAKAKYLGKSGVLTEALKSLGKLSAEERPKVGAEINLVKQGVEEALEKKTRGYFKCLTSKTACRRIIRCNATFKKRRSRQFASSHTNASSYRIAFSFHWFFCRTRPAN